MSVKVVEGDLFKSSAQVLVNTVNCVGVMGKGIALEFKKRYPAMYERYKVLCKEGYINIGSLWLYKADDGKWILNFPTKQHWLNPSEIDYIIQGLDKFIATYKERGITSIAFPMLGCNNGGLDKSLVLMIMREYLNTCEDLDVEIYCNWENNECNSGKNS